MDRDTPADTRMDILDWNYVSLPPNICEVTWASPPCAEYSKAKTAGVRKLDEAHAIVKRAIDIIHYFDPPYWMM